MLTEKERIAQAERMDKVLKAIGLPQRQLEPVLGISQVAISKLKTGRTAMNAKYAQILSEKSGLDMMWILNGTGAEQSISTLHEPNVQYEPMINNIKDASIQKRFDGAIEHLMATRHLSHYNQVSDLLKVDYDHMNAVRGGHKPLTMKLLLHAGKYGGINANNILFGLQPIMIADIDRQNSMIEFLKDRVEELKRDKANMQLTIDSLTTGHNIKQTG